MQDGGRENVPERKGDNVRYRIERQRACGVENYGNDGDGWLRLIAPQYLPTGNWYLATGNGADP
jgi:hypothetical protein